VLTPLLAVLGIQLVFTAVLSLRWRVMHDASLLAYMGMLVERFGMVPHRDFFDVNMPATYLLFAAIERLVGHSDVALRLVDLAVLALILWPLGLALRTFGTRPALTAPILYGVAYIGLAPFHALQRESFMLVPIAWAVALLSPARRVSLAAKAVGCGALVGTAACLKPAMAVDALPIVAFLLIDSANAGEGRSSASMFRMGGLFLLGLVLLPAMTVTYLVATGALRPFLEMATQYWPLFGRLGGLHETIADRDRLAYLWSGIRALGGHGIWLIPAVLGPALALTRWPPRSEHGRYAALLVALLVTHGVYPAFSGQFWPYHWLPFVFSLSAASSLCWVRSAGRERRWLRIAAAVGFVVMVLFHLRSPEPLQRFLAGAPADDPDGPRVAEITAFLQSHLRATDTVQPLDWTGGAADAMLRAEARLATPFPCDFHFYHHISSPYIQGLRKRFLAALAARRPTYVIRILTRKPWVQGFDTTREFAELDGFLAAHYTTGLAGDGYEVLVWSR
jgi:hypothetical protein